MSETMIVEEREPWLRQWSLGFSDCKRKTICNLLVPTKRRQGEEFHVRNLIRMQ